MQFSSLPFKLSKLNSNLSLTLGYLNPALNNSALDFEPLKYSIAERTMVKDPLALIKEIALE